jgi:predicted MFS family arabinose efflux permease
VLLINLFSNQHYPRLFAARQPRKTPLFLSQTLREPSRSSAIIPPRTPGGAMSASQRLQEIRDGFERPFWVANTSEIFERLSYYGAFSSLAVYLQEKLSFSTEQTGTLTGLFGGMVWFLAIFGGAVADKLGFRRALSLAYLILAAAYFLIGSIGASCPSAFLSAAS